MVAKPLFIFTIFICWMMFSFSAAHAEMMIDLSIIKAIESQGDPYAINPKTGCYGLYQISEICLKDYNRLNKSNYSKKDLLSPAVNEKIASWYFKRIKKILASCGVPVNLTTLIAAYNWGTTRVASWFKKGMKFKKLPKETRKYIKKYRALSK